jgi:hypothetical protein
MIVRAWFLLCCAWAALWLYGGSTRADGPMTIDYVMAIGPFFVWPCLRAAIRFIVNPRPRPPYRREP